MIPVAQAMLVCGEVWVDPNSGKESLLGIFSQVRAAAFPVSAPPLRVYVALTDGRGTMGLALKLLALDQQGLDEEVVWQFDFEIEFSASELDVSKRVIAIEDLELPREGEYRFRLECNGEYVIETRLLAIKEE
jgi:hypothetical protein